MKTLKVAILAADGVDADALKAVRHALKEAGAKAEVVSKFKGMLKGADGGEVEVDKSYVTTGSIMYDAVFVSGGRASVETLKKQGDALHFVNEAFKHGKAIGAAGEGVELLREAKLEGVTLAADGADEVTMDKGVVTAPGARHGESVAEKVKDAIGLGKSGMDSFSERFIEAIAQHRHWNREMKEQVPA